MDFLNVSKTLSYILLTFCLPGLLLGLENEFAETVKAVKVVVDGV